jgi:hypothetical protein
MVSSPTQQSVLILGASGKTGVECIRDITAKSNAIQVHAFCRDPSKLSDNDKDLCTSIVKGNARNEADLEQALLKTRANIVIVSVGNGESVTKNDIRTASAEALAAVMKKPEFEHVHVIIVSSTGASSSRIIVGLGIGKLISYHLRHVLADHTGQESAFVSSPDLKKRTYIVRATALTDGAATGKLVTFGDKEKSPSIKTDRADLSAWITKEISSGGYKGGKVINVTGVKM